MGNVCLACSDKRDIGKTIIAVKTSIELSNRGKNVLLIDLAKGNKKIAEYFSVDEDIIYDVKDVLDGTCSMEQSIIAISENLSILPFPRVLNKLEDIKIDTFSKLLSEAKTKYDIIIVDTDIISSFYYIDFANVDSMVIINNNDFSAVKEINNACDLARKFELKNTIIIINKYNKKNAKNGAMLKFQDMNKMLEGEISGVIDDDTKYVNVDYDFLNNKDINSFNNAIDCIANRIYSF
nr:AAA family ATPase [Sedimentibacter sp.]